MKNFTKTIILLLFLFWSSPMVFAQIPVSAHQEQHNYYKSLGELSNEDYDLMNDYQGKLPARTKSNCALDKIVFGWHAYWMGSVYNNYDWSLLSDFSYFSYEVDPNTGNPITTRNWATAPAVDAALQNGVRVNLCVTLFSGHSTFFSNPTSVQTLISNLINLVQSRGAHGVNIDFEGIPSSQKANFTNFMIDLSNQMHAAIPNSQVSTVLYAVDWNDVFDIPVLSQYVDLFVIMGYGYYYSGSATAGPTDPLYPFESSAYPYSLARTIGYYLKEGMPKEKLVMGLPYYGREWTTTSNTIPSSTISSMGSKTYKQIKTNSSGNYSNELWHEPSKTPYYVYNDGSNWRQCFLLNSQSLAERLDNILEYDIGGMGIWALGYDDGYNDLWNVIEAKMTNCYSSPCSDTLYDMGGKERKYYNAQDYVLTINPSNGNYPLDINFLSFDLENNYDYLYLYDGLDSNATPLGVYTGSNSPGSFTANSGALTMRFYADGATVADGWEMSYQCNTPNNILPDTILMGAESNSTLNCGTSYHLLYDSGGKYGNYGNNEQLSQTLCNSDSSKSVRVSFRPTPNPDIQIRLSSTTTGNDYVYIYNGSDETANLIGTYTGTTNAAPQPGTFVSSGHCLTISSKTDNSSVNSGFEARVYCAERPAETQHYVGGNAGNLIFTDNGGNADYGNNENNVQVYCPHSSAPAGDVVWAEFNDTLGIEYNWDYLYVFDGNSAEAPILNVYTGDSNNINIIQKLSASSENSSGCLSFQFFSDGATTASGWEATMYTAPPRLQRASDNCENATFIQEENKYYAGTTAAATGMPGSSDPALNISIASLPECSGNNTITRIENSVWYKFHTADTFCFANQVAIRLNNISCQSVTGAGSGVQFVLYKVSTCQNGINWGTPVYCADKLLNGDSVVINSLLEENTSYYIMIDGFSGQNCNFDLMLENQDNSGCIILNNNSLPNTKMIQLYPNPASTEIRFKFNELPETEMSAQIFDLNGRLVQQIQTHQGWEPINIQHLPSGMYIIRLEMKGQYYHFKFSKQ